jgi:hypothetical protein
MTTKHTLSLHFTTSHYTIKYNFTSLHLTSLHFTLLYFTLLHFTSLHFTSLLFNSLTHFLKICGLQGKVTNASAGRLFQSFTVLFTKEYFPISVLFPTSNFPIVVIPAQITWHTCKICPWMWEAASWPNSGIDYNLDRYLYRSCGIQT